MQIYKLHSIHNCKALYEGRFYSFTACLEQAVKDNVNLTGIDLRHKNLSNANLDDAFMPRADFTNTNLSGANLSDAKLQEANFRGAALYNTYFCSANLYGGNFENAFFGATDIWDADISHARFSALSCFSLDFGKAQKMHGCRFTDINGNVRKMSRPPIIIRGLTRDPIILLDDGVQIGHKNITHSRINDLAQKLCSRELNRRLRIEKLRLAG